MEKPLFQQAILCDPDGAHIRVKVDAVQHVASIFSLSIVSKSTFDAKAATAAAILKVDGDDLRSLLSAIARLPRTDHVNIQCLAGLCQHQRKLTGPSIPIRGLT